MPGALPIDYGTDKVAAWQGHESTGGSEDPLEGIRGAWSPHLWPGGVVYLKINYGHFSKLEQGQVPMHKLRFSRPVHHIDEIVMSRKNFRLSRHCDSLRGSNFKASKGRKDESVDKLSSAISSFLDRMINIHYLRSRLPSARSSPGLASASAASARAARTTTWR